MTKFFKILFTSFLLTLASLNAYAVLNIDINRGNVDPIPIAINDFNVNSFNRNEYGEQIRDVIRNNLENCGLFRTISSTAFLESLRFDSAPTFSNWRKINATAIIAGKVEDNGYELRVEVKMWDPYSEILTETMSFRVPKKSWRRVAHKISDKIYKKITGEQGYFDTRVVFIAESGPFTKKVKRLAIMDQDGANLKLLSDGKDLVITPRFDPKSQRIIYMSYKSRIPRVYILDLSTGIQKLIGDFPGMSFAPRFSPDGNYAIMSVAKNGTTNIYEVELRSGFVKQLTFDHAVINTSPSYAPDGKRITFNSDRGGSRQLYVMNRDGSDIKRISYAGGTYATPVWSPRGDYIAFTKITGGSFYIGVMRPDGSGERLITSSWMEEGPTWSPNGRVIMFERTSRAWKSNIYAVDITGYHERLIETPGPASDPAWSPLLD